MKNKVNIKIVLLTLVLSSIFNIVRAQESTEKVKPMGITIRSNSRDNQPKHRDNLHQRTIVQKRNLNKQMNSLNQNQKTINPNKKAILQRKNVGKKGNKIVRRNRFKR